MSVDITSIQILLKNVLEVGATAVVISDMTGLLIAAEISDESEQSLGEVLSAISSLLIPQGKQVADYLSGGKFQDTVIHTVSDAVSTSVLAYSLDSNPQTCIMIICDGAVETQIVHEFSKIKNKFIYAMEGVAVEIPDLSPQQMADRKVVSFWDTLRNHIESSQSVDEIKRALLNAKDSYALIHGGYSTVVYAMNTASSSISFLKEEDFDKVRTSILTQVGKWRKRILGDS